MISASGVQYFIAVIGWFVAAIVYVAGFIGTNLALAELFQKGYGGPVISGWVRNLSIHARQRLQETQARLTSARAR